MFRRGGGAIEVFLVHPGGPYFADRDEGAWTLPKGELEPGEEPFAVARREFAEETGQRLEERAPGSRPIALGEVRQRGGKRVEAWALEGDWPSGAELVSNTFELEWPPHSGRRQVFPEVDRGRFFGIADARRKLNAAQVELLDRLLEHLGAGSTSSG